MRSEMELSDVGIVEAAAADKLPSGKKMLSWAQAIAAA
jgi:hypothetical protein